MCNSFNKKQQRGKARRRASRNKPAQQRRRTMLIARVVKAVRIVLDEIYPDGYPQPEKP